MKKYNGCPILLFPITTIGDKDTLRPIKLGEVNFLCTHINSQSTRNWN